jgi:predicted Rossmann fold flavoprotein
MELSGAVQGAGFSAAIDLAPGLNKKRLEDLLLHRKETLAHLTMEQFLVGFFQRVLGQTLVKYAGIDDLSMLSRNLSKRQIQALASAVKCFRLPITGTNGFMEAQVTGGGASTSEFNPNTMASKKVKGLYAVGELLDIYGGCGGFNLQWAWSSGFLAGKSAAESVCG